MLRESFTANLSSLLGMSLSRRHLKDRSHEAEQYSQAPPEVVQASPHVVALPAFLIVLSNSPCRAIFLTSCRDSLCPQAFSGLPGYCRCVSHLAGSGQKKIGKYVPSFLPPNLAAAINAQTNPHTGAAAAAAAISSRLGGVSRLSGRPVLLQQPANISDSRACRLLNV